MSHKRKRFLIWLLAVMTIFCATIFVVHAYGPDCFCEGCTQYWYQVVHWQPARQL